MVQKYGNCTLTTSNCSFNASNTISFQQIYFWSFSFDTTLSEQSVVRARQGLPQSYIRDQVWWQRCWAIVLIFLSTPLKVNKLWHKCSKGTTQTTQGKATRIPFQLCKIHLVFPLQTNKQTNKQTVAVQNGSDRYVSNIFHILKTRHCYILLVINNQLWG